MALGQDLPGGDGPQPPEQVMTRLVGRGRMRTPLGQMIDWVPAAEKLADPPNEDRVGLGLPEGPADGREFRPLEAAPFELETESADVGPPGTVPVLHVDPEAISWTRTLQEFLAKDGRILRIRPDGDG